MNHSLSTNSCCCNAAPPGQPEKQASSTRKTARALPSVLLSILIAFFPKCPLCWAVYMSMFGSLGLAQLPYMGWLLPVLVVILGIHLFMLYRRAAQKGYLPFFFSLAGALILLYGRTFYPAEKWILVSGMVFIISGSLLNSFFTNPSFFRLYKNNHS